MLKPGDMAPDFVLKNAEGKDVRLSDFRGKWVVLYFYPKDDTPGCTKEAIGFTELAGEFEKLGAVIIGVSPDPPESHVRFMRKYNLNVNLLSDTEKEVLKKYGAWGKKKMYGKEYEGVIRSTYLIDPDGKIVRVWPKVKVEGHAKEVLETLRAIVNGGHG